MQKDIDPSTAGGQFDGKTFTFTIPSDDTETPEYPFAILPRADNPTTADVVETGVSANKIYVSIPAGIPSLDPADFGTSAHQTYCLFP